MSTSFSGVSWAGYTDVLSSDDEMLALFHTDELYAAAQEAISGGNPVSYEDLSMNALGFDTKLENKYSDLFPDGVVYEIDAAYESSFTGEASIRTFIAIDGDSAAAENYVIQGDEKLYFMFVNESENDLTMQADVDGWLTPEVKVVGTSAILDDEDLDPDESEAEVTTKPSETAAPDIEEPDISTDSNADKSDGTDGETDISEESGTVAAETVTESESTSEEIETTTAESTEDEKISDQLDDDNDSEDVTEEADEDPVEETEEEKSEVIGLSYHDVPRVAVSIDTNVSENLADESDEEEETETEQEIESEESSEEEKEQPSVPDEETTVSESSETETQTETAIESDSTETSSKAETAESEESDSIEKDPEYKSEADIHVSGKTGEFKGTLYGTISIDDGFRARAFVTSFSQLSEEGAKLNTSGYSLMINQILHDGEQAYSHPYEVPVTDDQWIDSEILNFASQKVTAKGVQPVDPEFKFSITRSDFQESADKPGTYIYNADIHYNLQAGYKVAEIPEADTSVADTPASEQAAAPLLLMSEDVQQNAATTIIASWEDLIQADNSLEVDLDMEKIIPGFITDCVLGSKNQFNTDWTKGFSLTPEYYFQKQINPLITQRQRIVIARDHLAPTGNAPEKTPAYLVSAKLKMDQDHNHSKLLNKWGDINAYPVQKLLAQNLAGLELLITNPSKAEITITIKNSEAYGNSYNINPDDIKIAKGDKTNYKIVSNDGKRLTLSLKSSTVLQIPITALYQGQYYVGYARNPMDIYVDDSGEQIAYCHNYDAAVPPVDQNPTAPNGSVSLADYNDFPLYARYDYKNLEQEQLDNLENKLDAQDMDQEKIIALLYAGYPFDCEKLMEKYKIGELDARRITQAFLWQYSNESNLNNWGSSIIKSYKEKQPEYTTALEAIINNKNDYCKDGTLIVDGDLKMTKQSDGSYQTGLITIKSSFGGSFRFTGLSDDILILDNQKNPIDSTKSFDINSKDKVYPSFIFQAKTAPADDTEFTLNVTYNYQKPALYYYEYLKNPVKRGDNWFNDYQNLVRIHLTDNTGNVSYTITVKPNVDTDIKPNPDPTPSPEPTPGGGGSNDSGGPEIFTPASNGRTPTPITSEILPSPVPLASLPTTPFSETLLIIDDGNVPLAALPKTGQSTSAHKLAFALASLLLAIYSLLEKRKKQFKNGQ